MSRMEQTRTDRFKTALLLMAATGLIVGLAFYLAGQPEIANLIWIAGVVPALAALVVEIVRSIGRGEVGLDIVAALSMSAALVFGETLAAAVVAVSGVFDIALGLITGDQLISVVAIAVAVAIGIPGKRT